MTIVQKIDTIGRKAGLTAAQVLKIKTEVAKELAKES